MPHTITSAQSTRISKLLAQLIALTQNTNKAYDAYLASPDHDTAEVLDAAVTAQFSAGDALAAAQREAMA